MTTTRREFLALVAMGVAIAAADPTQAMRAAGAEMTSDDLLWQLELGDRVWLRFTAAPWQGQDSRLFEVVSLVDDTDSPDRQLMFRDIDGAGSYVELTRPDGTVSRERMDLRLTLDGAKRR